MLSEADFLPWFASHWWAFGTFAVSLVLFHVLLIRSFPLTSIGWKHVDYVWLTFALLGMVAAVAGNRTAVATSKLNNAELKVQSSISFLAQSMGNGAELCKAFLLPIDSPDEIQFKREVEAQCDWVGKGLQELESVLHNLHQVDTQTFLRSIPRGGSAKLIPSIQHAVEAYNASIQELQILRAASKQTDAEIILQFLGPALFAIALALRITKVSGEIALERKRHKRGEA